MIEGSVKLLAEQIKVQIKLTDTVEGHQLWAQRYVAELTATNLIEIQEGISHEISSRISGEYGIILQKLSNDAKRIKPGKLDSYMAVLKFYYYQLHFDPGSYTEAFDALSQALVKDEESGTVMALLATMHGDQYMLDSPGADESFRLMGRMAEKAIKFDPNSILVNVALTYKYFVYGEREQFLELTGKHLSMNPVTQLRLGAMAFHLSLYGKWEEGVTILIELMKRNVGYPMYFHGATSLYYYRKNDYESALIEADKYNIPALFWGPLLRLAVLGQLGRMDQAQPPRRKPGPDRCARRTHGLDRHGHAGPRSLYTTRW